MFILIFVLNRRMPSKNIQQTISWSACSFSSEIYCSETKYQKHSVTWVVLSSGWNESFLCYWWATVSGAYMWLEIAKQGREGSDAKYVF